MIQKLRERYSLVLNLIINGLPSILPNPNILIPSLISFKPYYKWITFNTLIYMALV